MNRNKATEPKRLEKDIYGRCVATAKGYYSLLRRRKSLEEAILYGTPHRDGQPSGNSTGDPTGSAALKLVQVKEEIERKILAVEQAWGSLSNPEEKEFIKKNLFQDTQMQYIVSNFSIRTMKRIRKRFLYILAKNLKEV